MKSGACGVSVLTCAMAVCLVASAEVMDRPTGIKIGQRLTLTPYVALSATYDTNAEGRDGGSENVYWTVSPGFGLNYKADSWSLLANVMYQYNAYMKDRQNGTQNYHGISENVTYRWSNSVREEKGWSLMLAQSYLKTDEDTATYSGLEYGTDRQTFNIAGAVQRRFGMNIHADLNAGYYWLDYDNDNNYGRTYNLYGWERAMVGGEIGWAPSRWTDFLLAGSYQYYTQDNTDFAYAGSRMNTLSHESDGVTVQGGFGSFATDHISYRVLAGWSQFKYGGGSGGTANGFTYTVDANWRITETWNTMLLATSYYQPTERDYGSSQRVDALSWGIAHSMVSGKLKGAFDIAYRHESPEYCWVSQYGSASLSDYTYDSVTFRLSFNYVLNRFVTLFTNFSYRKSVGDGRSSQADYYTYDRFTGTLGVRLTY